MRKPTIWVSDQVRHKPCCTVFGFKKKRDCTIRVAKTKALISFAVTAKLICGFVFTYANCWFSHAQAHIYIFFPAYYEVYGNDPVWKPYRRNFAGQFAPETRKTCIVGIKNELSHKKSAICICKSKDADQLHGNREADQCLCFRYTDSTLLLLLKSEISSF